MFSYLIYKEKVCCCFAFNSCFYYRPMEQRWFNMHGVFTTSQWNRDDLTCMVVLLQASGTEIIWHAWWYYYRPMEQRSFDMHGVFTAGQWNRDHLTCMVFLLQANGTDIIWHAWCFLLQANGTEEMKTQVGEEEEDDMKETPEETETAEEQEQSKPFQSINQPVNLSVKRYQ